MSDQYGKSEAYEVYQGFARVYDEMMAGRDYGSWADYVSGLAEKNGVTPPGRLLDVACGTGSFLEEMSRRGWSVYGVDNSAAMLGVAQDKLLKENKPFLLFQQDMRELELGRKFQLITCLCDSLNYLLKPEDLLKTLQRIKRHLTPGGVFIADLNSEYKYRFILGDGIFAETFQNSAYIWENSYDLHTRLCRMEIDFFIREEGELFRHILEVHLQRSYRQLELMELAQKAGFGQAEIWQAFSNYQLNPQQEEELLIKKEFVGGMTDSEVSPYGEGRFFLVLK